MLRGSRNSEGSVVGIVVGIRIRLAVAIHPARGIARTANTNSFSNFLFFGEPLRWFNYTTVELLVNSYPGFTLRETRAFITQLLLRTDHFT